MRHPAFLPLVLLLLVPACGDDEDPPAGPPGPVAYERKHETVCPCGGGWFGGDNRGAPFSPRSVGNGVSVLIDDDITMETFAFFFERRFDYFTNPTGTGNEVTLRLNIRNDTGGIVQTEDLVVPDTFNGGWVTWDGINMDLGANTTVIFTAYLVGAFTTNQFWSSVRGDLAASDASSIRYEKEGTDDASLESWAGWGQHQWDTWYWITGVTR